MEQLNLPTVKDPRPTSRDSRVIERVVEGILPDVMRWDGSTEGDKEDLRVALHDAFDSAGCDVYRILRDLDDFKHWTIDAELKSVMEMVPSLWLQAEAETLKEWVRANKIKPAFAVGDMVSVPYRRDQEHQTRQVVGEIYEVDEDQAKYHVFVESLGHVRKGEGTHGLIIRYEDATPD